MQPKRWRDAAVAVLGIAMIGSALAGGAGFARADDDYPSRPVHWLVGRIDLPDKVRRERRAIARAEVEHFVRIMEREPIGVQIGIVPETLPHTGFQIFRQPDRQVLALSPFRLGEEPNVRVGVAMITSAPEALALHHKAAEGMWARALKGAEAARYLRELAARHRD